MAVVSMESLNRLARLDSRFVAGLISGTSADGVDAALVRISGTGSSLSLEISFHGTVPYDDELRARVLAAGNATAREITDLHFDLGRFFAQALRRFAGEAGVDLHSLDLIGSHGQTIWHAPPSAGKKGATLQLGDGNVLAEETGLVTITDFRAADLAAGGEGAPLVPYLDWALFHHLPGTTMALNLGGIANVTIVPGGVANGGTGDGGRQAGPEGVIGFDTGPANMVLDALAARLLPGAPAFDREGAAAARGRVHEPLLRDLLKNAYFECRPPKSTGRELFGESFVEEILEKGRELDRDDLIATTAQLTASSVADAVERFVDRALLPLGRVVVSGGGVHNSTLMNMLSERFHPVPVLPSSRFGMPVDGKEAVLFAVLASETLRGTPTGIPRVTGASGSRLLGKISLPPARNPV